MSIIMKDQAGKRWMKESSPYADTGKTKIKSKLTRAALVYIAAVSFVLLGNSVTSVSADTVRQDDFLVSPDMNEYMHKQGHGMIFNDMDMQ